MIKTNTLKTSLLVILLVVVWSLSYSQTEIKYAKAYRNVVDFKEDKAIYITKFNYKLNPYRSYEVYKPKSDSLRISAKEIKYGIWIISDKDHYYFNTARHGFKPGYIKLEKGANYYYFYSKPALSVSQQNRINNAAFNYGLLGGATSSVMVSTQNNKFQHSVLDFRKGTSDVLSVNYIQRILKPFPDLLNDFNKEENKIDLEVLKMYLDKVNEKLKSVE